MEMKNELNVRLRKILESDLEQIMYWRMLPEITRYMNTDPKLTIEGQRRWYQNISESQTDYYWILEVDGEPAGVASLVEMDTASGKIHTGVYIAEKRKRSLQLTMELQWNLYDYAFEHLGMHKVCEEIFAENKAVVRILDMCGSKREGVLRDHVYKNGEYHDVIVRGILKDEWQKMKENISYHAFMFEE